MLVLTRKLGEKVYIGNNVVVTIVDIGRGQIRLGIDAPRNIPILRSELGEFQVPNQEELGAKDEEAPPVDRLP